MTPSMVVTKQTNMQMKKEQVNMLIQAGQKKGLTGKDVIDALVRKGYEPEGVNVEAIKQNFVKPTIPTEQPESTFLQRETETLQNKGAKIADQISGTGEFADKSALERGVGATATTASALSSTAYNALPEVARNTLDKIGGGIGKGFQYLVDKISNNPALQEAVANPEFTKNLESSLKIASDLGLISGEIAGVEGIVKPLTKVQSKVSNVVDDFKKVPTDLPPSGAGLYEKLGQAETIITDKILPKSPEIMNRVARLKPTDATKFKNMTGKTQGEYLSETGNFGAPDKIIQNEATKFAQTLASKDAELAKLPGVYKDASLIEATSELVKKAEAESSGSIKSPYLDEALNLQSKALNDGLNQAEINTLKRLFEKNVKLGYNKLTADSSVIKKATNIDTALRQFQDETAKSVGFTNLPELNKQIQTSKFLIDKLGDEVVGKNGLNDIGLTDWIVLSGGDPTAVSAFLTKKFFSSKSVQAKIAEMLNSGDIKSTPKATVKLTPEGIERQVSPKGLKQLEAPKSGSPKSQINTPINQPSRKAIEQGTEIVPRTSKTQPQQLLETKLGKASLNSTTKPVKSKGIPNKQGGFINFGEIAKLIDNTDKDIMLSFNEAVLAGKKPSKSVAMQAQKLADTIGLQSATGTNKKIANDFQAILDMERENFKKKMK